MVSMLFIAYRNRSSSQSRFELTADAICHRHMPQHEKQGKTIYLRRSALCVVSDPAPGVPGTVLSVVCSLYWTLH